MNIFVSFPGFTGLFMSCVWVPSPQSNIQYPTAAARTCAQVHTHVHVYRLELSLSPPHTHTHVHTRNTHTQHTCTHTQHTHNTHVHTRNTHTHNTHARTQLSLTRSKDHCTGSSVWRWVGRPCPEKCQIHSGVFCTFEQRKSL